MKTLAGGFELNQPVYADAIPNVDRRPAPADEVSAFMAKNLFHCQLLAARISAQQCEVNRSKDLYSCGKCDQTLLAPPVSKKRQPYGKNFKRAMVPAGPEAPASPWRTQLYDRAALAKHEAAKASDESGVADAPAPQPKQVRSGQVSRAGH